MIRYIHGSEDSIDIDVFYVFDAIPDMQECKRFCYDENGENRNIIVIKDGIVTDCFIGTIDEVNNSLLDTYSLHEQEYPLLVTRRVERDVEKKIVRATRGILSIISRTQYRSEVKIALRSGLSTRLDTIKDIDFTTIDFSELNKQFDSEHCKKVIAFQIGQSLGLLDGVELYTKSSIAKQYPVLKQFVYRETDADLKVLNSEIHGFVDRVYKEIPFFDLDDRMVQFLKSGKIMELRHETYVM